ncbi:MAG: DUF1343 domain-containing protein [Marinilabiliales bacterium]|nr:MAG: DUF1343 domain-containing protein [Marinilabiliales bacterium]
MLNKKLLFFFIVFFNLSMIVGQRPNLVDYSLITTGAQQFDEYKKIIEDKNVGVVANKASVVKDKHLVDLLMANGISIAKVFSPEHGFRGDKDAGEHIDSKIDKLTGLQIVSLYGNHKKPTKADLENIDVVIFDLQDVGVRFYTYISTLTYVMEACAENNIKLVVLDRPNPNGFYVDGPVLEMRNKSFVGMHPVPIVYGMTIGEYAKMINGQSWLEGGIKCDLTVIQLKNYKRNMIVKLPIKPSPNLPNWESVYLYPFLCLFEGTIVSVGRGTDFPFQVYGHPKLMYGSFVFTPQPNAGSSKPKLMGENCYGQNLKGYAHNYKKNGDKIDLLFLIEAYNTLTNDSTEFFNNYFVKLAGTDKLEEQIKMGWTEEKIKGSWKPDLEKFMDIRKKYLMYN